MSGRIYDYGINPICDICGSKMWTSSDRNFNGAMCKRNKCKGSPIYEPFPEIKPNVTNTTVDENGKYILHGEFTSFGGRTKNKYTTCEKLRNMIFTMKEVCGFGNKIKKNLTKE